VLDAVCSHSGYNGDLCVSHLMVKFKVS
jgi:hypothetical protein